MNNQKTICQKLKWLFLPVALCFWFLGGLFVNTARASEEVFLNNLAYSITTECCFGGSAVFFQSFTIGSATSINKVEIALPPISDVQPELWDITTNTMLWKGEAQTSSNWPEYKTWNFSDIALDNSHTFEIRVLEGNQPYRTSNIKDSKSIEWGIHGGYTNTNNGLAIRLSWDTEYMPPPVNIYTDVITPTPQINYRPMQENTYQIFRYTYNTNKIPNNIFGGLAYIEAELCLNIGCSSTSPLIFNNGVATSTKAYMFTGTGEMSTTTSQYGSSFFTIETPTDRIGTTTAAQERYKITPYYFRAATLETIRANPIVWVVNYSPQILENPTPKAATSTFASIFGASPHDLACSEEEWASIATNTPWYEFAFFDFTRLKCNGFETGLVFVEYAINIPVAIINGTLDTIGNIFPFGLITKIIEQWNLAKTETMPEDLLWLSPVNQEGDLTIDIPGTWTNSTTTEKVAIFGDTLFKSTYPTLTTFFEGIRSLSTYGIWFGLIMLMWIRGKDTYNEIMADKTQKKHEDSYWQY